MGIYSEDREDNYAIDGWENVSLGRQAVGSELKGRKRKIKKNADTEGVRKIGKQNVKEGTYV